MNLFNLFRRKKVTEIPPDKVNSDINGIFFHEDFFNQVEFLPRENLFYLKSENKRIDNFTKDSFDGHGFSDIYARNENPITITDRKIQFEKLDSMLTELDFKKTSEVYEGYGATSWRCKDTFAYTLNGAQIFVGLKNNLINDFWINGFRFHKDISTKAKLKKVLFKIGDELYLILNDWDLTIVIDLKNGEEIQKYLDEEL